MFHRVPRLVVTFVLLVVLTVPTMITALPANAAIGDGRILVDEEFVNVRPGQQQFTVTCPSGSQPVSAGVDLSAGPRSLRFRGTDARDRLVYFFIDNVTSQIVSARLYALCLRTSTSLQIAFSSGSIADGVVRTQAAECASGTRRLGGWGHGFASAPDGGYLPVLASYPSGSGWAVKNDNRHAGAKLSSQNVYAACASPSALGRYVPRLVVEQLTIRGLKRGVDFVACPRNAEIASGGFIFSNSGAMLPSTNLPAEQGTGRNRREGWQVSVVNRSSTSETFSVYAVCLVRS